MVLLSGISGLSFDFAMPVSSLVLLPILLFFLSCHFYANSPFSWLFQKPLQHFLLRVTVFCLALVQQLGNDDGSLLTCGTGICHYACTYCCCFYILCIVSVHSTFIFFLYSDIDKSDRMVDDTSMSYSEFFVVVFNKTNSSVLFSLFFFNVLCMYFWFYIAERSDFIDLTSEKVCIYEKSFELSISL